MVAFLETPGDPGAPHHSFGGGLFLWHAAFRAMEEVKALHAATDELAGEAMDLVRERALSAPLGAVSLAVALGRLCAVLELDPQQMKDCIDIAYKASRQGSEETP